MDSTESDRSLGTIGDGNHFAELQKIESVLDHKTFESFRLSTKQFYLLVHSGSRGLGEKILNEHTHAFGQQGISENTVKAHKYINKHDMAVKWAKANRALFSKRFLDCLHAEGEPVLDVFHNTVTPLEFKGCYSVGYTEREPPLRRGNCNNPRIPGQFQLFSNADRATRKQCFFVGPWCRQKVEGRETTSIKLNMRKMH